ncbi:MAG: hypothetical protein INF74_06435 [Roseomonas sp.]|nr:hypothetical protein [Roseomonas sp.]
MARKPKAGAGEPARPEPAADLFGLGQARLEGKALQDEEARADFFRRMALAQALIAKAETPETKLIEARALFDALCRMMGESKARAQWQAIAKRRRGRPLKVNQKRADLLCRMFDGVAHWIGRYDATLGRKVQPNTVITILAEILIRKEGGHSKEAKAQEIRRALRAREKQRAGAPVVTKIGD